MGRIPPIQRTMECCRFWKTIGTTPYGFILPIRNWKAGTPTLIGTALSANSVYLNEVCGITLPTTEGAPPVGYAALAPTH